MTSPLGRQLDNYFATVRDLSSESEEWTSRPSWLEFAPNNVCNLRCIMCGQADGLPVVAMKREEARALLGQILPTATVWTPSALSEPLLADFRMVLEECRKHDVHLDMYTNATLTTGEKFREMADRAAPTAMGARTGRIEISEQTTAICATRPTGMTWS